MQAEQVRYRSLWVLGLVTLLLYLAAAALSLAWPSAVDGVSHLYLATGAGLACVLAWGRLMAIWVGLGSMLVVVGWTALCMPEQLGNPTTWLLALTGGLGGGLQAWLGARLTQGSDTLRPTALDTVGRVVRFFVLAGLLACVLNAALCTATMVALGTITLASAPTVGVTWWAGDAVGVILGAPIVLSLIGQPKSLWEPRRRIVGIPLMVAAILMGWGVGVVQRWEHEKAILEFKRQAESASTDLRTQLKDYLDTLETLRGLFDASDTVTRSEFHRATQHWLAGQAGVVALGWGELVSADQLNTFEQQARAEGLRQFEVFDLPGHRRSSNDALVVKYIEPMARNHAALGYNLLSHAGTQRAFEQSTALDTAISAMPGQGWQAAAGGKARGIVVFQSVASVPFDEAVAVRSRAKGAVFVAIDLEQTLRTVLQRAPDYMRACLRDVTDGQSMALAGGQACEAMSPLLSKGKGKPPVEAFGQHAFVHDIAMPGFGQRQWQITIQADTSTSLGGWSLLSAMFGIVGVAMAASLGCLLLVVTGHNERLSRAMNDARRQRQVAEEASNAKSEFLSRMSHELRTPLNAMLGFAQVMELDQDTSLSQSQRNRLDQIQQAGWHLLDMIDDVLDISSIDTGALPLQTEPIAVESALSACVEAVEPLRARHGVDITVRSLLQSRWRVLADPTRLQQILSNLMSNAVKYNQVGGKVHILASVVQHSPAQDADSAIAPPMAVITFTDTGSGMSGEQLQQLFQPFSRLGRAKGAAAGMGIGLVISRHLAQLMGGTLEATSKPGDGSVFTLSLPAVLIPDTPPIPPATTAPQQPDMTPEDGRKYILYVEDNDVNSAVMQAIMRERPSIDLQICGTIEEGLASLHDRTRGPKPDLILLDLHLPDASGLELLTLLKANPDTQDIPVVMISADAMPEQIDACLKAGAACYLTKPIQIRVLLQQIDDLL